MVVKRRGGGLGRDIGWGCQGRRLGGGDKGVGGGGERGRISGASGGGLVEKRRGGGLGRVMGWGHIRKIILRTSEGPLDFFVVTARVLVAEFTL
jgi:hypothetical protein